MAGLRLRGRLEPGRSLVITTTKPLEFRIEWQRPEGARGEELRATWASLQILVNGEPVTELLDRDNGACRSHVFLPLYPLAEWIANHWWNLESETDHGDVWQQSAFDQRHDLRWAREGFALPSLKFVTLGESVEVQWRPRSVAGAGIQFVADGRTLLSLSSVRLELRRFVELVIRRLDDVGVSGTTLHETWRAIQASDLNELEFCRAAARLGADPYSIPDELAASIVDACSRVRPELCADLLSLSSEQTLMRDAQSLVKVSVAIQADDDESAVLETFCRDRFNLATKSTPWQQGYLLAQRLRQQTNPGKWKSRSLDELANYLGIGLINRCLLASPTALGFADAVIGENQRGTAKLVIPKRRSDSKQFAFCRALFDYLVMSNGEYSMVSRLRTERQRANRAFAAELLAPHEMLRADLSGSHTTDEEIADLAADYGVSEYVIRHQLRNHGLATLPDWLD